MVLGWQVGGVFKQKIKPISCMFEGLCFIMFKMFYNTVDIVFHDVFRCSVCIYIHTVYSAHLIRHVHFGKGAHTHEHVYVPAAV